MLAVTPRILMSSRLHRLRKNSDSSGFWEGHELTRAVKRVAQIKIHYLDVHGCTPQLCPSIATASEGVNEKRSGRRSRRLHRVKNSDWPATALSQLLRKRVLVERPGSR